MKIKTGIFSLLVMLVFNLFYFNGAFAQRTKTKSPISINKGREDHKNSSNSSRKYKKKDKNAFWIIGVGGNVVDDDGSPFRYLFNALPRWNLRPYPTRLTIEKSMQKNMSVEMAINFNLYKAHKIINGEVGRSGIFLSGDLNFKNRFLKDRRFDPYVVYGLGGTFRTVRSLPVGGNINVGLGSNFWFTKTLGINVQSIAKFGISPTRFIKTSSNYLQHSLSFVMKLQKGSKNPFIKPRYPWVHRKNLSQERN